MEYIYDALYKRCTRRNFIKLVGAVIGTTIFGSYVYRGSEIPHTYYQIYEDNKIAKALNIEKNSIDFQDSDHYTVIQNVLDSLPAEEKKKRVLLKGNFVVKDTIKIPSHTLFELDGSITLDNNVGKILVTQAYRNTGDTNIEMIGGIYDANKDNQCKDHFGEGGRNHAIEFPKVVNSSFTDIIIQNAGGDGFVLDTYCNNNNIENLLSRNCGITGISDGNGLDDRGDHNIWKNCIAENNYSDNWVIKCRNSTFINCIGRGSINAVGFGLYGDRDIIGNQFIACEAYNNKSSGMTISITEKNEGFAVRIMNNSIQGIFYDNQKDGVRLRDLTSDGIMQNNNFDISTYNNEKTGFNIIQDRIINNSGTIVAYDNKESDCNIGGRNNTFRIFAPKGRNKIKIESGNNVNYIDNNAKFLGG